MSANPTLQDIQEADKLELQEREYKRLTSGRFVTRDKDQPGELLFYDLS
jgi:hypothetical protein